MKKLIIVAGVVAIIAVAMFAIGNVAMPCLASATVCEARQQAELARVARDVAHADDLDGWGRTLEKAMITIAIFGVASTIILAALDAATNLYILAAYRNRRIARGVKTPFELADDMASYHISMEQAKASFLGGVETMSVGQLATAYDQPQFAAQPTRLPEITFADQPTQLLEAAADNASITLEVAIAALQRNQWQMIPGVGTDGSLVRRQLEQNAHNLIMGASGQGKSTLAAALMACLVAGNDASHFQLRIGDIEGITSQPFEGYADIATEPEEIVQLLEQHAAEILERRSAWQRLEQRGMPTYPQLVALGYPIRVMYIEEALALNTYLDDGQYRRYITAFEQVALLGRKWGACLLTTKQVDYSDDDFKRAMRQFLGKYLGAVDPAVARSQGFRNAALVQELYEAAQPGLFLSQQPGGAQLVRAVTLPDLEIIPPILASYRAGPDGGTTYAVVRPLPATSSLQGGIEPLNRCEPLRTVDSNGSGTARERVLACLRAGDSISATVQTVWAISKGGGRNYMARCNEVMAIVQELAALNSEVDGAETTELAEVGV